MEGSVTPVILALMRPQEEVCQTRKMSLSKPMSALAKNSKGAAVRLFAIFINKSGAAFHAGRLL